MAYLQRVVSSLVLLFVITACGDAGLSPRGDAASLNVQATAVTATIAAGSLALAAYAATSTSNAPADASSTSIGQTDPALAADAVSPISADTGVKAGEAYAEARELRAEQGADALALSADLSSTGVSTLRDASEAISAAAKAERVAESLLRRTGLQLDDPGLGLTPRFVGDGDT